MAPIVHGLERRWSERIDFVYLDVADSATTPAKARLGFRATPHFFLLRRDGTVAREFQGVVPEDSLAAALAALAGSESR